MSKANIKSFDFAVNRFFNEITKD